VAESTTDEQLRAMALHRGFKLIRSRKRTPGVGDFGKFGLTDMAGKPVLGIDDTGLSASGQEIEDYLRGSALSTWKLSAETTPAAKAPKKKLPVVEPDPDEGPIRRKAKAVLPKARAAAPARRREDVSEKKRQPPQRPALRLVPKPAPEPPPPLNLRPARAADAPALSSLLGELAGPLEASARIADNIERLRKAKGSGLLVAERDEIIGCCGWTAVPTLQHGSLGRITLLLVRKDHRRDGVGSDLLAAAELALAKAGCAEVEAMSDIMVANAHNFFRSRGFEQKSYRFVRKLQG
jgi:N-acetylglutamate synthase-like GNAT family acetyltransferase